MTRILHTSDWHLGATLEGLPRDEEHELFLAWLAGIVERESVDMVVVAGDVFEHAQPSASAQGLYYRFLSQVAGAVRKVVVAGGNHDSPSRLDAPRELLSILDVHVVGGLPVDDALGQCLCPIEGPDGEVACVVATVPYVHAHRLGARPSSCEPAIARASAAKAFRAFYRELADAATALAPGVPMIATGHLAALDDPSGTPRVGDESTLPPSIFDPRFAYVALGHVHRAGRVGESQAHYCGTPVPLQLREAASARYVLLYDTDDPEANGPAYVEVPTFRPVVEAAGTLQEVCAAIRDLDWTAPLAPFVYPSLHVDAYTPGIELEVAQAARDNPRGEVRILQPRQVLQPTAPDPIAPAELPHLRDMSPEEVFMRLCKHRGETADAALLGAFRSLLDHDEELAA